MALRHTFVIAAVSIGLPLAGVAAPAGAVTIHTASTTPTTTTRTTTAQCQGLLGCVVPVVSGLTGGLITTVPTLVNAVPTVLGSVPATLSNLLGTKHQTHPPQGTKHPPKKPHHGKPAVKPRHHPKAPATSAPRQVVAPAKTTITNSVPTAPPPTVLTPPPTTTPGPVTQVITEVAHVAQKVVSLFGWNLLALIPMAGIAFVISRRMSASRRSVSGLL